MSLRNLIKKDVLLLAHRKEGVESETLQEHSDLVYAYYEKMDQVNQIEDKVKKLMSKLFTRYYRVDKNRIDYMMKMFRDAIYLHDIGKINPAFQRDKMLNDITKEKLDGLTSNHALLSSVMYIDLYDREIDLTFTDEMDRIVMRSVMYHFSYVMSRHHTYLEDLSTKKYAKDISNLMKTLRENPYMLDAYTDKVKLLATDVFDKLEDLENYREERVFETMHLWLLNKMLYSALVTADFMATYEYMQGSEPVIETFEEADIARFVSNYEENPIVANIRAYQEDPTLSFADPINKLRSDMFLMAEETLVANPDKGMYYLEAPTGSGKTMTSINLALTLLKNDRSLNKMQYIFPFNTLIEQTKGVLDGIFRNEFRLVNSTTAMTDTLDETTKYDEVVLQRQNMQYRGVLTSHVNLFSRLFGNGRTENLAFTNLCNSVVVIDEIQSYRNEIWLDMVKFMHVMSDVMNIKFVIMSATLPNLSRMIDKDSETCELITDRKKFFESALFKDRVNLDFSLIENKYKRDEMDEFVEDFVKVYENHGVEKKYLIEFITRKSARAFYDVLLERLPDATIIEISGDDNKYYRNMLIEQIRNEKSLIVVATQVIEAGVDIDMDVGLKDISMLDSEEQFLGRINRSCKREGIAYFFNMDEARFLYRNDFRVENNLKKDFVRDMLGSKNFGKFYDQVARRLISKARKDRAAGEHGINQLLRDHDYGTISDDMRLIVNNTATLFLDYTMTLTDGSKLRGRDVLSEYIELLNDESLGYSEKKVKLSRLNEKMSYFSYTVYLKDDRFVGAYSYTVGDMYVLMNADHLIDTRDGIGKFNRDRYDELSKANTTR